MKRSFVIEVSLDAQSVVGAQRQNSELVQAGPDGQTATSSAPRDLRAFALSLVTSRVTALTWNLLAVLRSARIDLTTEPPCFPVAPNTTRICLDIASKRSAGMTCVQRDANIVRCAIAEQQRERMMRGEGVLLMTYPSRVPCLIHPGCDRCGANRNVCATAESKQFVSIPPVSGRAR